MNSIEKLKAYQDGQKIVNEVEDELDKMVDAFFAEPSGERIATWFFKSLEYDGIITEGSIPKIINLGVEEVIMGEGENYTFPVPSSIISKYLDGDKEESVKEFQKWHEEYWEQKKREEEEAKRREEEALAKAKEEDEYKLYLKLKDKFEK